MRLDDVGIDGERDPREACEGLERCARRQVEEAYPYLVLDARYEKIREDGVIRSRAVLVAIGVTWEGRRWVLGVELANRESASRWKDFLLDLRQRGLRGVEFIVSESHSGLRRASAEVLPDATWQRCYVHFLRNALDHVPRRGDDDCLRDLRWIDDRRCLQQARKDLAAWLGKGHSQYPKLCDWVETHIEETSSFSRLPVAHPKHMTSTNMLARVHEEIQRRRRVVRIFPNAVSCLRLVRALAVEMHENWIEAIPYVSMEDLREHTKEAVRRWEAA